MKRLFCSFFAALAILGVWNPQPLFASQVYGHLYFADMMLKNKSAQFIDLQDRTRSSFFLGSLAPDSAWIAHMITNPSIHDHLRTNYGIKFPPNLQPVSSQIDDIHQLRPTAVTLQLFESAETEEDRAFAVGWLSHYIVDAHIHDLVNRHGGFVAAPSKFDSPAMKVHNRLEALEMRHVLELNGPQLRLAALSAASAPTPGPFLRSTMAAAFPQNNFYVKHQDFFYRTFQLSSSMMIDYTRWYGYQSQHNPSQILRMKRLIRRFRPSAGKLLEALTDLPSRQEYHKRLSREDFLTDWAKSAAEIQKTSALLMDYSAAYFWWKDRYGFTDREITREMSANALTRIEKELIRINPRDDLMRPHRR